MNLADKIARLHKLLSSKLAIIHCLTHQDHMPGMYLQGGGLLHLSSSKMTSEDHLTQGRQGVQRD